MQRECDKMAKSLEEQLGKILKNKNVGRILKYDDGKSINDVLRQESRRLKDFIAKYIQLYYVSYYPSVYDRTEEMLASLCVEPQPKDMSIHIYFDDRAYHPSAFPNSMYLRFVPTLMDSGWAWKNQNPSIYRFTYFEGEHFIEKAIMEFKKDNRYKLNVTVDSLFYHEYYAQL